jgi:hypothetical protein
MGICRSHVSLARGRLWLLPMLYVRFVQDGKNHSGKCPESVSGKVSGMSGFMKRCHGRHRMHGRPGGMLLCNSPPQETPMDPNETVFNFMHIICDYVFM